MVRFFYRGSSCLSFFRWQSPFESRCSSIEIALLALWEARSRPMDNETWYGAFFLSWLIVPILLSLAISIRKPMFVNRDRSPGTLGGTLSADGQRNLVWCVFSIVAHRAYPSFAGNLHSKADVRQS